MWAENPVSVGMIQAGNKMSGDELADLETRYLAPQAGLEPASP